MTQMMLYGRREELATMANNKKLVPIFLLSALMLSACSNEIIAKPTNYDDPLIVDAGTTTLASGVPNNSMNVIYDAIRDGGTLSGDVLNEVLYQLAISVIGRYNSVSTSDTISLEDAVANIDANETNNETVNQFLTKHPSYWIKDADGNRKTDELTRKREYRRVKEAWNRIQDKISESVYDAIAGGSYSENNFFSETKYLMSLRNDFYKVANPNDASDISSGVVLHDKVLILPEVKKEETFSHYVHKELLEDEAKGFNYISQKLVPEIYRNILVEQYLFDQSYNTIGRAYARNVNIISLSVNNTYPLLAGNLMNAYIDNYINCDTQAQADQGNFELISKAWRGINLPTTVDGSATDDDNRAAVLLSQAGAEVGTLDDTAGYTQKSYSYWKGTAYGGIVENLKEVNVDPQLDNTAIHSDFTGTGKHTVAAGFELKVNTARVQDYTEDGFFIKNGGLSSINETIRTRLFNIGVANALDKNTDPYPDRFTSDGVYAIPENEGNYVCKIHGRYFLKPSTSERSETPLSAVRNTLDTTNRLNDFLWFDKSASKYYIVEVTEAVSSSKLSETSDKNYEGIYGEVEGWNKMEDISHDVAKVIAQNDSYKTLSTQYWLKAAAMAYHDDVIYQYFVDNYPDLFD